jgi:hypothetical protein
MKNYSSKANIINRLIPLGAERNAGENKGEKKKKIANPTFSIIWH